MTLTESTLKYPALMAYILDRNTLATSALWCDQLRLDEQAARSGELSEVAEQMKQAQADYGSFPYNSAMGEFLGLAIKGNGEPAHGYYMANAVKNHYTLGAAQRRAAELIAENRVLRMVTAKDKKTRQPIRFAVFQGPHQIKVQGQTVSLTNGKRRVTLSSNWSCETSIVNLVSHLETGEPISL